MIEDEVVKKYNLTPPGSGMGSARDAAVIFKIASELKPEVRQFCSAMLDGSYVESSGTNTLTRRQQFDRSASDVSKQIPTSTCEPLLAKKQYLCMEGSGLYFCTEG
jgi:hypothetical protein